MGHVMSIHDFTGLRCLSHCECQECKRCGMVPRVWSDAPCEAVQLHEKRGWLDDNLLALVSTRFQLFNVGGFTLKTVTPKRVEGGDFVITVGSVRDGEGRVLDVHA